MDQKFRISLCTYVQGSPYIFVTFHNLEIEKSYFKSALEHKFSQQEDLEVSIEMPKVSVAYRAAKLWTGKD